MGPGNVRLQPVQYAVIYADCPWSWKARSPKGEGRSAKNHYPVMRLEDIKALPVASIATDNSVLFLWAIDPMLEQALEVVRAWGFVYKTVGFYWVKTTKDGLRYPIGTGYYTRANPELCLLATRGKGLPRLRRDVRKLVIAPRRAHSQKPEEVAYRIGMLYGDTPKIELFARTRRPGWAAWGNEVTSDVSIGG